MGVDAMAGIPAKQISEVLSPFGSLGADGGGKPQSPQDGPGLIKLPFSKASYFHGWHTPGLVFLIRKG